MARQNFLSKEFFVAASEFRTKALLLNLPQSLEGIKFLQESKITTGITFLYEQPNKEIQKIDISLLPLNDEYTHVTLHASYTDGHAFYRDTCMKDVLLLFEQAIQAIVEGRKFQQAPQKKKTLFQYLFAPFPTLAFLSLRKKLS